MRVDNKVKFRESMGPKRHKKISRSLTTKGIWKLIAKKRDNISIVLYESEYYLVWTKNQ
jgi:hypothetical protein